MKYQGHQLKIRVSDISLRVFEVDQFVHDVCKPLNSLDPIDPVLVGVNPHPSFSHALGVTLPQVRGVSVNDLR